MKKSFVADKIIGPIFQGESRVIPLLNTKNILVPLNGRIYIRDKLTLDCVGCIDSYQGGGSGEPDGDDGSEDVKVSALFGRDSTVVFGKSNCLVEVYNIETSYTEPIKTWKSSANSAITFLTANDTLTVVAHSDGILRVYDTSGGFCVNVLKGQHKGIVSFALFLDSSHLVSSGEDGLIVLWDISGKGRPVRTQSVHKSGVTALAFDGQILASGSRDGTLSLFTRELESLKTVSVQESVEDICCISKDVFGIVGDGGCLRVFSNSVSSVRSSARLSSEGHSLRQIMHSDNKVTVIGSDGRFSVLDLNSLEISRLYMGSLNEITDIQCLDSGELVVSTGDPDLKIFESPDSHACRLLTGHKEAIISIAVSNHIIVTGSRDCSAKIWSTKHIGESIACIQGHTDVVSAVATIECSNETYLIATASSDLTIKLWKFDYSTRKVSNLWTTKAHDKDINALCFASSEVLLSGSQDKTLKAWNISKGTLSGSVMTGHKRGIWSVSCSSDRIATGSSDKSIRLWSLATFQSIKTLEGHSNSVLKVLFLPDGNTLASTDSDGLVKIWDLKKGTCICSLDGHQDRIWALSLLSPDCSLVTGDSLGFRRIWRDVTSEVEAENAFLNAESQTKEQELINLINRKDYRSALKLTLSIDQPGRSFNLISRIMYETGCDDCRLFLSEVIRDSSFDDVARFMAWIRDWNLNFKRSIIANLLLRAILDNWTLSDLAKNVNSFKSIASDMIPFLERNSQRVQDYIQNSFMADLVLMQMNFN